MLNEMRPDSVKGILTLLNLPGVGPRSAKIIAGKYPDFDQVRVAVANGTVALRSQATLAMQNDHSWVVALQRAESILEDAERENIQVVTAFDELYPINLQMADDKPLVLYVKGQLPSSWRCMACIGTREPSELGTEVARRITNALAERGWSIISGLALGVDSICHEAALDKGGHTVAVLANGLDTVYPEKNRHLAERILENGGALLSEQPFGAKAIPRNLVQRDRIQSGLSVGVIVMQTDITGGSMHTVRYTLLQGRRLFAPLPEGGFRNHSKSRGNVALTEDSGAVLSTTLFPKSVGLTKQEKAYHELLIHKFAYIPVATPLRNLEDLISNLNTLEEPGHFEDGLEEGRLL